MPRDVSNNPSLGISVALERRPKMLPLRATFDSINLRVFADNKQLQQIDNANWQVLFGRRGAGKTTLLATYASYITRNVETTNRASIELNVTDFISVLENGEIGKTSDIEVAQIYFADFLEKIAMHLFQVFSKEDKKSKFVRLFLSSEKRDYIQDLILRLVDSIKKPTPTDFGAKRKATRRETSISSKSENDSHGLSVKAAAGSKGADFKATASLAMTNNEKNDNLTLDRRFYWIDEFQI